MLTPSLSPLALVLAAATGALAFDRITTPETVDADTPTTVHITNDLDKGDKSFDAGFSNFRVYLALSPPGWGLGPACYLVNSSAIDATSVTVTIPASVVPDGTECSIATMEFNADPDAPDGPSGFEYSSGFTLAGGTGEWSALEKDGRSLVDADAVPCSAYDCARACGMKFYPADEDDNNDQAMQSVLDCIAQCPGVTADDSSEPAGIVGYTSLPASASASASATPSAPLRPSPASPSTAGHSTTVPTAKTTPSTASPSAGPNASTNSSGAAGAASPTVKPASAGARVSTALAAVFGLCSITLCSTLLV